MNNLERTKMGLASVQASRKSFFSKIRLIVMLGCLCYCAPLVAAQAPAPPSSSGGRAGSINGRVLGEDGSPAAFVFVGTFTVGGSSTNTRSVLTDSEGGFIFRDLPPVSYRFSASAPGYVTQTDPTEGNVYHIGDSVTLNLIKGGVITGRVTTSTGEPVIAVQVSAQRVRDAEGKPVAPVIGGRPSFTDDQGVFRLYGLRPGSYLVGTNGGGFFFSSMASAYDGEVPVYYPSSTRDTASEVHVLSGGVASGIDIRYRAEVGHVISGKLSGSIDSGNGNVVTSATLSLRQTATGNTIANAPVMAQGASVGYELRGIPDGDYEISASFYDRPKFAASLWRRVQVRGTDVTGVDLVLSPLATVTGRVVLEAAATEAKSEGGAVQKCAPKRQDALEELLVRLQRDEGKYNDATSGSFSSAEAAPDNQGAFTLNSLQTGRYRMLFTFPSETWYAKAIATGATPSATTQTAPNRRPVAVPSPNAGQQIALRAGEKIAGITVTLAAGAAALRGQVVSSKDNAKVSLRLRVHLLPADPVAAEDVLRYAETLTRSDGTFQFKNLAPGRYWLLTRMLGDEDSSERPTRPLAWDATERAKLRREAEAAKQEVELTTCQSLADFKLPYSPTGRLR